MTMTAGSLSVCCRKGWPDSAGDAVRPFYMQKKAFLAAALTVGKRELKSPLTVK